MQPYIDLWKIGHLVSENRHFPIFEKKEERFTPGREVFVRQVNNLANNFKVKISIIVILWFYHCILIVGYFFLLHENFLFFCSFLSIFGWFSINWLLLYLAKLQHNSHPFLNEFYQTQRILSDKEKHSNIFSDFLIAEDILKYQNNVHLNRTETLSILKSFAVW